jgi:hypothetical protein
MRTAAHRQRRITRERGAIQFLEEAFHLLRSLDPQRWLVFYLGAVPFAVGLLYFGADMGRSGLAADSSAWVSLAMVGLYGWLRWCQACFCAGLWETLSPGQVPRLSRRKRFEQYAALFFVQAFQIPLLIVGGFFTLPIAWIIAFLQSSVVLALTRDLGPHPLRSLTAGSMRHCQSDWAQNHGILILLAFVTLFTWVNILATCVVVPTFGKMFFGIESLFTINPAAATMNSTFQIGVWMITWLVMSPVVKAVYVLRCFYEESRTTGADLMSRLADCQAKRRNRAEPGGGLVARTLGLVTLVMIPWSGLRAEVSPTGDDPVKTRMTYLDFERELTKTLEQKKYQWTLSRHLVEEALDQEETWIGSQLRDISRSVRDAVAAFSDWLEKIIKELLERDLDKRRPGGELDSGFFKSLSSSLSIGLVVVLVGALIWFGWIAYRKYRTAPVKETDGEGSSGTIDLTSEDLIASQLPESEWVRLARERLASGDHRLAVRALFLATLAQLGDKGLLRIARFKSNRDYGGELLLRARSNPGLREAFGANTVIFERAWYGLHKIGDAAVAEFLGNHERITEEAKKLVS